MKISLVVECVENYAEFQQNENTSIIIMVFFIRFPWMEMARVTIIFTTCQIKL